MTNFLIATEPHLFIVGSDMPDDIKALKNMPQLACIDVNLSSDDEKLAFMCNQLQRLCEANSNETFYLCHWMRWLGVLDIKAITKRITEYADSTSYSCIELGMRSRLYATGSYALLSNNLPNSFINAARLYILKQIIDERALSSASALADN